MNTENYYVYCHSKITDGRTFYVGKGCGQRAWSLDGRTKEWLKIAVEHGRQVHILQAGMSEQKALDLERSLIAIAETQGLVLVNIRAGGSCTKDPRKKKRPKQHVHGLSIDAVIDIRQRVLPPGLLAKKYGLTQAQVRHVQIKPRRHKR
jgi:hypothetical protein